MKSRKQEEDAVTSFRNERSWFEALVWMVLSVVVFAILFRLGFRAAQARRVTWLMAVLGALYSASLALYAEVRQMHRLPQTLLCLFGMLGGLGVAFVVGLFGNQATSSASLLAGALIGGGLGYFGRWWR